ncbi:MAG: ChbG/HpnK family deacetylase [Firmicutes bacterium]|nr:ChbG/HpnK family deacetylase [Bacillota bacterium]
MQQLIVNAKDMGLSAGVNKGIIQGYRNGIISSVSMLVNLPSWEHALRHIAPFPGLGVGLQFNISLGKPVSPPQAVKSLVDPEGSFHGEWDELALAPAEEIRAELCAQLDLFKKGRLKPTHIDGFEDILAQENVLSAVLPVASRLRIPVCSYLQAWDRFKYFRVPTVTACVDSFGGRGANRPNLERLLGGCRHELTEFRCRPGLVDSRLNDFTDYAWERERELAVLCSINKEQVIAKFRLHLVDFSAVS